ncbi:MAG: Lrp/AsnC family transcriptional regulator [Acidimicrobiia bacterium]|nr:Lrp/AsnC family transcriptional regulator [Acidimicrobiia bacterium]MDH5519733.1 Lrp/AsnC family transcriptional regulator [Acidimicrobiia bacterium]
MDAVDRKIIALLRDDSRISVTDLADEVPISISAASERLKRLTRSGMISRFTIELNAEMTGRTIDALIEIRLPTQVDHRPFDEAVRAMPAVVNALHLTGPFDYQLRVQTRDVPELDAFLSKLKLDFGVAETNTRLALRTVEGFPRPPSLD